MAQASHSHRQHAFEYMNSQRHEGLCLHSRRNVLKAGLAGIGALTLPELLRLQDCSIAAGKPMAKAKSVILLWMAGGPSHIDTWDPKPDRPFENRGPFGVTSTKLPGVHICEHLPKQAAMLDRFTILRSVDAKLSNHEPNKVFQTGFRAASPRTNRQGELYPSVGSIVSKLHGPNVPSMPAYVAFQRSRSHVAYGGWLGKKHDPFLANQATSLPIYSNTGVDSGRKTNADLFSLPAGISIDRIGQRRKLVSSFDRLKRELDVNGAMEAMSDYDRRAVEMLVGGAAREAFDINRESQKTRDTYGKHLWCQQALLARRLVESGVSFVTLDLSYHPASGTWDTHGDNIPPYGGIKNGLGPLLPLFDHLLTTLVLDLDQRGILDDVLVIAMGEFGRTPNIGTQGSVDGRNHWPVVMSMAMAGGGLNHGQVIGSTEHDGGHIKERPVTPGDLAATIYRHMDVPLDATFNDHFGRPRPIIEDGSPIAEL